MMDGFSVRGVSSHISSTVEKLENKKILIKEMIQSNPTHSSFLLQPMEFVGIWEKDIEGIGGSHNHPLLDQIRSKNTEYIIIQDDFIYIESVDGYD